MTATIFILRSVFLFFFLRLVISVSDEYRSTELCQTCGNLVVDYVAALPYLTFEEDHRRDA